MCCYDASEAARRLLLLPKDLLAMRFCLCVFFIGVFWLVVRLFCYLFVYLPIYLDICLFITRLFTFLFIYLFGPFVLRDYGSPYVKHLCYARDTNADKMFKFIGFLYSPLHL